MANTNSAAHVRVIKETPAYWRVVFDYPPFNIVHPCLRTGTPPSALWKDSRCSNLAPQHSVQIECGTNQSEMCKGLREIT
jgi:hypothetical protein